MTIIKETAPYLRKKTSVSRMMIDVLIALLPVVVFSLVINGIDAFRIISISILTMLIAEFIYVGVKNIMPYDGKKHTFIEKFKFAYSKYTINNFLSPLVSAIIYAMILPASVQWYAVMIGALAGIVLGKLLFGGLGNNIFNPAAVGMIIAKISFGSSFNYSNTWFYDVATGGTPLTALSTSFNNINSYSLLDLLIGKIPGTIGETCAICILIGGVYLLIRRSADWRPVLAYLGTFTLMVLIAGICINSKMSNVGVFQFTAFELLSGGVLFGAIYMITDPVTSPVSSPGRVMFGVIAAVATVFIRLFGAFPEGVGYSILIANMLAPTIDYYKWSSSRFTWKKIVIILSIILVAGAIMVLGLLFGGVIK